MRTFIFLLLAFASIPSMAQHEHSKTNATADPFQFQTVRSEWLTDVDLKGYKLESSVMTIAPGATDTVSHRHDCDLFGYVLEGEVQIGLDHAAAVLYKTGQMFFEKRNVLHSLAANPLRDHPTRVLLLFLIKDGRAAYTPEYPVPATRK
jgi:quercetin dioxygenase-like cupin family protein